MKIQVFCAGCPRCEAFYTSVAKAASTLSEPYEIEKVTDLKTIASHGVLTTPALAINGKLMVVGKIPSETKLAEMLHYA